MSHDHERLLLTLARHGRFAAAATLLFSTAAAAHHRTTTTTRALNALLAALCSCSWPSSSSPTFLRAAPSILLLAAPRARLSAATFHILATALCRRARHGPTAAADLLRCMPGLLLDPDPRTCRAVLASLPARDALAFLDDMRRWGVTPRRADHRAVLGALLREEGLEGEAYELVVARMDADGVAPGLHEFEVLLRAFREKGSSHSHREAVEEAFDEMLLRGIVPGVSVYDAYVGALCDGGDVAAARRMLGCMERAGCPPGVSTVGVVVAGCVAKGDVGAATEVAREAVRRGLRWDAPALSELVSTLRGGGGGGNLAPALLLDVLRDGCAADLDAAAFEQLITGGEGAALRDEAAVVVGDGETPASSLQPGSEPPVNDDACTPLVSAIVPSN